MQQRRNGGLEPGASLCRNHLAEIRSPEELMNVSPADQSNVDEQRAQQAKEQSTKPTVPKVSCRIACLFCI